MPRNDGKPRKGEDTRPMRERGTGTCEVAPDGRLKARLTIGHTPAGNPRRIGKTWPKGTPRKVGLAWLAEQQTLRDADQLPTTGDMTVGQFLERWLAYMARRREETTLDSYRGVIKNQVLPYLGDTVLAKLAPLDVEDLQAKLAAKNLSPRTIRYAHGLLSQALKRAVRWRLVPFNAAAAVDPPPLGRPKRPVLTADQARAFLAQAERSRLHALWLLAITTGMRRGELLGVRWQDVDLDAGTVRVENTVAFRGKAKQKGPKNEGSERTVAISADVVAALRARLEAQALERIAGQEKGHWTEHGPVFASSRGTPLEATTLKRERVRLLHRAAPAFAEAQGLDLEALERDGTTVEAATGLDRITTHALRRTYISLAARHGVSAKVVADRVGHVSTRVTQDVYEQVYEDTRREAALSSEDLFSSASERARAVAGRGRQGADTGGTPPKNPERRVVRLKIKRPQRAVSEDTR